MVYFVCFSNPSKKKKGNNTDEWKKGNNQEELKKGNNREEFKKKKDTLNSKPQSMMSL